MGVLSTSKLVFDKGGGEIFLKTICIQEALHKNRSLILVYYSASLDSGFRRFSVISAENVSLINTPYGHSMPRILCFIRHVKGACRPVF